MVNDKVVVYKRGEVETRIDPKVLELILLDDLQVGISKLNRHLEKAEFEGKLIPRTLPVTDKLQQVVVVDEYPFVPWICAYFINDGPDTARLAINYRNDLFELKMNETVTINHANADERIRIIYHICDPGETASVRVKGQY